MYFGYKQPKKPDTELHKCNQWAILSTIYDCNLWIESRNDCKIAYIMTLESKITIVVSFIRLTFYDWLFTIDFKIVYIMTLEL